MQEKKETEEKKTFTESEAMTAILDRAIPKSLQARLKELEAEHESGYRLHPDKVAVWDVSTNAIDNLDGTPGYYDVITGSERDRDIRGEKAVAEFTGQGLRITDRYEVVINHLPVQERICKYSIVDRKEWESYAKGNRTGMLTTSQEVAGLMRRSGGTA